ncbi:DNA helicase [Trifolium repens]|nr:DNA helicase [Trifolium repens]
MSAVSMKNNSSSLKATIVDDIKKEGEIFGKVKAVIYTIEFQKRGLPHAHILNASSIPRFGFISNRVEDHCVVRD